LKSKYDTSTCTNCNQKIAIGVEIEKNEVGKWVHSMCPTPHDMDSGTITAPQTETQLYTETLAENPSPEKQKKIDMNIKIIDDQIDLLDIIDIRVQERHPKAVDAKKGMFTKEIYRYMVGAYS